MKKLKLLIIVILTVKYALAQNFPNQKITYYSNGNIKTQYTYQDSILNGPYIGYYENGQKWSEGTYKDGGLVDTFKVYTPKGDLAYHKYYLQGKLLSKRVFWQDLPSKEFVFVSREGFYVIKNGKQVELDSLTPDGIIQKTIDENNNIRTYIWKAGKKILYGDEKPDKTKEIVYDGEKAGVYEWHNGKLNFIRKLNKQDFEDKKRNKREEEEAIKKDKE